ncbi:MAG: 50S ribosome-binding GTPase, partial [Mycoplasmataceae bacterium]|nr:50S ribosome-binding GTPase [Mycoplasmataceae bacterium]
MKKTYDIMNTYKDKINFVIQVVDARAISYSSNKELLNEFNNSLVLTVALKSDLADLKQGNVLKNNSLILNKNNHQMDKLLINQINNLVKSNSDISYYKPIYTALVLGLPNVGKSTLINKLIKKKNAIVMDKPGTTKKITIQKINNNLYLYDAPGIMYKKIEDITAGYVLCLIGTINKKVVPLYEVIKFAINFLKKYYINLFYKLSDHQDLMFDDFLNYLIIKWNFKTNKDANSIDLVLNKLYGL